MKWRILRGVNVKVGFYMIFINGFDVLIESVEMVVLIWVDCIFFIVIWVKDILGNVFVII